MAGEHPFADTGNGVPDAVRQSRPLSYVTLPHAYVSITGASSCGVATTVAARQTCARAGPSLCADTEPPCSCTSSRTMLRPRPRPPRPASRRLSACAKASKMDARADGGIPTPVSMTQTSIRSGWARAGDAHLSPGGRELHGVLEEVHEDLREPYAVAPHRDVASLPRYFDPNLVAAGRRRHIFNRTAQDVAKDQSLAVHRELSVHAAG